MGDGGDDLLKRLPGLSREELLEVGARARALAGSGTTSTGGTGADAVLDAVARVLSDAGMPCVPAGMIRRAPYHKAAQAGAAAVSVFVRSVISPPTKAHEVEILDRMVRMLARWLEEIRVPVTQRNLCINLDKIPAIVDRQFPGYRASGLLQWILAPSAKV